MKTNTIKFMMVIAMVAGSTMARAQVSDENKTEQGYPSPTFYLGTSTGVNYVNGILGLNGEAQATNRLSVIGGLGLSSWGFRGTAGIRFYKHFPKGLYYTASYSGNSGVPELEIELETTNGTNEMITLELEKAGTLNLGLGGQFAFARNRVRLNLEAGYSVPLQKEPYTVLSDNQLSEVSKAGLQLVSPGGIILGLGLSVGF